VPRKSNDDLRNMTLRSLNAYSDTNPAEGLRIAKECFETQLYATKKYYAYQKKKVMNSLIPGFSDDLIEE
jgi:hypothetical protein